MGGKNGSRISKSYATGKECFFCIVRWKSSTGEDDKIGCLHCIYQSSGVGLSVDEKLSYIQLSTLSGYDTWYSKKINNVRGSCLCLCNYSVVVSFDIGESRVSGSCLSFRDF